MPPLAFLVAVRLGRRRPTADHPYGFHRATGIGHLTAAIALLAVGLLLAVDSTMGLVRAEHPPIGTVRLLGHTFWAGWLMVAAMVYTGIGPFVLGRMKLPLAEQLHDKVLYADADMQKADWMTAAGTIAGVLGIGLGLWWADAGAALLISLSIVRDGWTNLHYATTALMDERARTYDDDHPHPLTRRVDEVLADLPWVDDSRSRVRDQGHVFHVESFVRPASGRTPTLDQLEAAADLLRELDWKVHDVVVVLCATSPRRSRARRRARNTASGGRRPGRRRGLPRPRARRRGRRPGRGGRPLLDGGHGLVEGRDHVGAGVLETDAGEARGGQVAAECQLDRPVAGVGADAVGGRGLPQGGEVEGAGAELVLER